MPVIKIGTQRMVGLGQYLTTNVKLKKLMKVLLNTQSADAIGEQFLSIIKNLSADETSELYIIVWNLLCREVPVDVLSYEISENHIKYYTSQIENFEHIAHNLQLLNIRTSDGIIDLFVEIEKTKKELNTFIAMRKQNSQSNVDLTTASPIRESKYTVELSSTIPQKECSNSYELLLTMMQTSEDQFHPIPNPIEPVHISKKSKNESSDISDRELPTPPFKK